MTLRYPGGHVLRPGTNNILKNMRSTRFALVTVLLAAVIFDRLFWHQSIGVNLTLFALIILGILLADHGWRGWRPPARWTAAGTLVSVAMVAVHGSTIATIAAFASLFTCTAFVLSPRLRSTPMALLGWVVNLVASPIGINSNVAEVMPGTPVLRRSWWWGRVILLPLLVLAVFFTLYSGGNSRFHAMTAGFLSDLSAFLEDLLEKAFTPHMLFFLFAVVFTSSLLMRSIGEWLSDHESRFGDMMRRVRIKRPQWLPPLDMAALDRERRMALVLLVLVNSLLLVVNAIDVHWIWFGFRVEPGMSLKEFVHEGTWLLIVSILLSMAILLRLFRGNLNFHPENRWLKVLATVWIVQNSILGISVFLRNYHYIGFHGLAYKRIGVIVFLALVLVGLFTLYLKVRQRRTLFHLLRVNAWAAFVMLVGLGTVDWDSLIVRYNLAHWNQGEIDVDNYLAMSDKVLPILFAHSGRVYEQMRKHQENEVRWVTQLDPQAFAEQLEQRRVRFLRRYLEQGWPSWTWADARTNNALATVSNSAQ